MKSKAVHIKIMVCDRCIASVKKILPDLDIPFHTVELGKAVLKVSDFLGVKNLYREKIL